MNSDFLGKVKSYFTTEFKQQIGLSLNEDSRSVDKALNAILPLGMSAALQRVDRDKGGMSSIFNLSKSASNYLPAVPDLAKLHNEEIDSRIASDLFGDHESAIKNAVAKYAGIKNESASALILLAMPVLLGTLGKYANQNSLSPDQLDSFIGGMKGEILNNIPEGIKSVASIFGLNAGEVDEKHIKDYVKTESVQPQNRGWIAPVILVLIGVALLIYFSRGCNKPNDTATPAANTASIMSVYTD